MKRAFCALALPLAAALLLAILGGCKEKPVPADAAAIIATPASTVKPVPTDAPAPTPSPVPTPDPAMQPVTFAWISDTQGYCAAHPDTFYAMADWILQQRETLNIQYVIHTGDVVDARFDKKQWAVATEALTRLSAEIPVFAVAGNHDIGGVEHYYKPYGALMDALDVKSYPTLGAIEEQGRRRYDLVTVGPDDYLIIGVGYCISGADTEWMQSVLDQYPDRKVIVVLHWFLNFNGLATEETNPDGRRIYLQILRKYDNIELVLCGHKHRVLRSDVPVVGEGTSDVVRTVPAVIGDYQGYPDGGSGYIMLLTFDPAAKEIRFTSYSPVLDDYNYLSDTSVETFTVPYLGFSAEPAATEPPAA